MRRQFLAIALIGLSVFLGVFSLLLSVVVLQGVGKGVLLQQTFLGRQTALLGFARFLEKSFDVFYRGPRSPTLLPHYDIAVRDVDLQLLEEAILHNSDVYLYSDDAKKPMDGIFIADSGASYAVSLRVRGDRYPHWRFPKKSWRITVKGDNLFRGMREFNLILPEDRSWFMEALSAYRAEKFDLPHPPLRFVTLTLNGQGPMLYLEVEHWTKEMLEKGAFPGDVNFFKTGGVGTSSFNPGWDPILDDSGYWRKYRTAIVSSYNSYEEADLFLSFAQFGAHRMPHFAERLDALFGISTLARWYAVSVLAGSPHVGGDNFRFFFDTSRGVFQPFVWDVSSSTLSRDMLFFDEKVIDPFWREVSAIPAFRRAVYEVLLAYVRDEKLVREDIAYAEELRALIERAAYRDRFKYPTNREVRSALDARMQEVHANIAFLQRALPSLLSGVSPVSSSP